MFGINPRPRPGTTNIQLPKTIAPSKEQFPPNLPVLAFAPGEPWTLGDAYEGTQIFGGTGSGKTSSSGRAIAHGFLRRGMGGLVLCAKPGECDLWLKYAAETGRKDSIVVFDGSGRERLNFLDYSARRSERFDARSLVELFTTIMEAARGESSGGDNAVWQDLAKELLTNTVAILHSAYGRVTLGDMLKVMDSAPQSAAQTEDDKWRDSSFCFKTILKMATDPAVPIPRIDQKTHGDFFRVRWANRHSKVKTSIEATFSASAYPFMTGYLRELFCTHTTVMPEMAHEGVIFIIDLPVKSHGAAGILAQHIWKFLFQKAAESRKDTANVQTRPVFIWADESQFFFNSYDREFQSTARSSKACTVYITQNLPTYYDVLKGKGDPRHAVNALLGSLQTKIFHQNQDADTNKWASEIVGKDYLWMDSYSENASASVNASNSRGESWGTNFGSSSDGSKSSFSSGSNSGYNRSASRGTGQSAGRGRSVSQQLHEELQPAVFTKLRKGGTGKPPEAIVMQGGRLFKANGNATWLLCQVPQS